MNLDEPTHPVAKAAYRRWLRKGPAEKERTQALIKRCEQSDWYGYLRKGFGRPPVELPSPLNEKVRHAILCGIVDAAARHPLWPVEFVRRDLSRLFFDEAGYVATAWLHKLGFWTDHWDYKRSEYIVCPCDPQGEYGAVVFSEPADRDWYTRAEHEAWLEECRQVEAEGKLAEEAAKKAAKAAQASGDPSAIKGRLS